jgi:hypothetical protein
VALASRFARWASKIDVSVAVAIILIPIYKNNLLTDVSSWFAWIARPIKPAIESTLIFGSFCAASVSGIVFVTTTSA